MEHGPEIFINYFKLYGYLIGFIFYIKLIDVRKLIYFGLKIGFRQIGGLK